MNTVAFLTALLCLAFVSNHAVMAQTDVFCFNTTLSGTQSQTSSLGVGFASAVIDDMGDLHYNVSFAGLEGELERAAVYDNSTGQVVFDFDELPENATEGTFSGTWSATAFDAPLLQKLIAGLLYINLHTSEYSNGEISGIFTPITYCENGTVVVVPVNPTPTPTPTPTAPAPTPTNTPTTPVPTTPVTPVTPTPTPDGNVFQCYAGNVGSAVATNCNAEQRCMLTEQRALGITTKVYSCGTESQCNSGVSLTSVSTNVCCCTTSLCNDPKTYLTCGANTMTIAITLIASLLGLVLLM